VPLMKSFAIMVLYSAMFCIIPKKNSDANLNIYAQTKSAKISCCIQFLEKMMG